MNDKTILIVVVAVAAFVYLKKKQTPVITVQQQQATSRNINNQLLSNLFGIGWTSLTNAITQKNDKNQDVSGSGVPIDSTSLMQYYDGEEPEYGWF